MELVRGVPITEFCDKNHSTTEERLKLFVSVCHAIQHAHQKGMIHRDIKPSNVMVTLNDGAPVVKVIDFGVAKATEQRLTEKTLFTSYGQMIGTPAYMSPEQASMSLLDVDTRSDIYSLGVLLYELLTGTTPIEAARLREAGYAEIQRLIREVEPPRPSTRLSSLGDSATVVAGNRATEPRHLFRLLAGDLDWIVMKALEKDRNRRYAIAGEFCRGRGALLAAGGDPGAAAVGDLSADEVRRAPSRRRCWPRRRSRRRCSSGPRSPPGRPSWRRGPSTRPWRRRPPRARRSRPPWRRRRRRGRSSNSWKSGSSPRPGPRAATAGSVRTSRSARPSTPPCRSWKRVFKDQPLTEARLRMTLGESFWYLGDGQAAEAQYRAGAGDLHEAPRPRSSRHDRLSHPARHQLWDARAHPKKASNSMKRSSRSARPSSARTPGKHSNA